MTQFFRFGQHHDTTEVDDTTTRAHFNPKYSMAVFVVLGLNSLSVERTHDITATRHFTGVNYSTINYYETENDERREIDSSARRHVLKRCIALRSPRVITEKIRDRRREREKSGVGRETTRESMRENNFFFLAHDDPKAI